MGVGEGLSLRVKEKVGNDREVGERSRFGWVGPLGAEHNWRPLGTPCRHAPPPLQGLGCCEQGG